jgi:hypothetical protein
MTEGTAIRDTRLFAEDFVKLWDASSPGGFAERAYAPDYVEHHPLPGRGPGFDGLKELAALHFVVFATWKRRLRPS